MLSEYLKRLRHTGQSTAEYAVLLAVVAVALVTMQLYIKRGIQGRLRDLATQLAPSPGNTRTGAQQYESSKESSYITEQYGRTVEISGTLTSDIYQDGSDPDGISTPDVTIRGGYEIVNKDTQ